VLGIVTGCSDDAGENAGPLVVATTTILGDVVANVVGEDARVEVIMPRGADPHDLEASSRQVALIARADLVIMNGLHLEEGLEDVIEAARADGTPVFAVAPALDPLHFADGDDDFDPHVWLDPVRMAEAARLIAGRLAEALPGVDWASRADAYAAELEAAHGRIDALLAAVPQDRRLLVTNHDALGYFADRYGFEVVGVVIPGGSTLAEPGSEELARLVATIDALGIGAIFAETTEPADLARAISADADHPVEVVLLHTGSLGDPGTPADTLIGMLEENARLIAEALA
jgi:zinc/manganese transport system substrate-binding protein